MHKIARDVIDVTAWVAGGPVPRSIAHFNMSPLRFLAWSTTKSAFVKGVKVLLMQAGSADFITGDVLEVTNYFNTSVEMHHIFPRSYCEKMRLSSVKYESFLNRAVLSSSTNRILGSKAPSEYLSLLESNYGIEADRIHQILNTHWVEAPLLRADDFDRFIRRRASHLLDVIENKTGNTIAGRDAEEVVLAFGGPLITHQGLSSQ